MRQEELKNSDELLSADDFKLRQMLKNLESVSAPNDFEFHLKNRIANAKPSEIKTNYVWALRLALPILTIGVMFAAFWVLSGTNWSNSDSAQVPPVADFTNSNFIENKAEIVENLPNPTVLTQANLENQGQKAPEVPKSAIAQTNQRNPKSEKQSLNKPDVPENSRDFGFNIARPQQPNFNSNINRQMPETNNSISVTEILLQIGISVENKNGRLVVKSLTANGFGKSSGIRDGDVIVAIDNQNIYPNSSFKNAIEVKTIVILRNNVKQTIILRR
jgi:hypothetical protein